MGQRLTAALLLAVVVMLGVNLKMRLSTEHPRFDPEDETAYFRTESAFQYRYARLAAAGKPLPEVDTAAQWPEGVRPRRELTSLMERLTGLSYRWLAPRDTEFRWFVVLWVAVVSSLAIVAFYACAVQLTGPPVALAAAAAYGLSWAAQCDVIASYRLETLGLPLIYGSLACCGALLAGKRWAGPAAAAFVLAAFASWHLTRFYVATYLAAAAFAYWRTRDKRVAAAIAWPLLGALVAFALLPSARESSYGHVYGLLWAKLSHLLRHPADPAALTPIQRLEWTGPSDSPTLGFALFAFLPLAAVALPRARATVERSTFGALADALCVIYVAGTLLSSRLTPWLAFFLTLAAVRAPNLKLLVVVAMLEIFKCLAPASPLNPFLRLSAPFSDQAPRPGVGLASERELLGWLRRYGGPQRPALAPMGISAEILAYTGTPVLLQPKWEAAAIREKTAAFARALFEGEDAFAAYADKHGAKLFVYGADTILDETPEGLRYASGRMDVREDSAAYRFHFAPEKLERFSLVFQNEDFRVYAAGKVPSGAVPKLAVYDRAQYGAGPALDCRGVLRRMELARLKLVLGRVLAQMGRREEALSAYDESFAAWPADPALLEEYNRLRK